MSESQIFAEHRASLIFYLNSGTDIYLVLTVKKKAAFDSYELLFILASSSCGILASLFTLPAEAYLKFFCIRTTRLYLWMRISANSPTNAANHHKLNYYFVFVYVLISTVIRNIDIRFIILANNEDIKIFNIILFEIIIKAEYNHFPNNNNTRITLLFNALIIKKYYFLQLFVKGLSEQISIWL